MATKFNQMYRQVISEMNEDIMKQLGFGQQVEDVHNGICPSCKTKVDPNEFRDEVSKREYKISGLCQKCQDDVFGTDDEEVEEQESQEEPMTSIEDYPGVDTYEEMLIDKNYPQE